LIKKDKRLTLVGYCGKMVVDVGGYSPSFFLMDKSTFCRKVPNTGGFMRNSAKGRNGGKTKAWRKSSGNRGMSGRVRKSRG
jgi:hypothetical protein